MIDIGIIFGSLLTGYYTDLLGSYIKVITPILFISSLFLFLIKYLLNYNHAWIYYVCILALGLLYGGPYTLIGIKLISYSCVH